MILPVNGGLWTPVAVRDGSHAARRQRALRARRSHAARQLHELRRRRARGRARQGRRVAQHTAGDACPVVRRTRTRRRSRAQTATTWSSTWGTASYAFYGNLQPGSLLVGLGDRVQRRQVLATIGNSGDSTFPHLDFRLMGGASPIASDGLPFVLSGFSYEGQLDSVRFLVDGVTGNYLDDRVPNPVGRRARAPARLCDHRLRCCRRRGRRRAHVAPAARDRHDVIDGATLARCHPDAARAHVLPHDRVHDRAHARGCARCGLEPRVRHHTRRRGAGMVRPRRRLPRSRSSAAQCSPPRR